jgi:hypothetical protein
MISKQIKKIALSKKNVAFVDVDLIDNNELTEKYQVSLWGCRLRKCHISSCSEMGRNRRSLVGFTPIR